MFAHTLTSSTCRVFAKSTNRMSIPTSVLETDIDKMRGYGGCEHGCFGGEHGCFGGEHGVHLSVLTAHYGESPYKTCIYGNFLKLYGGGRANSILTTGITVPNRC
jgi:hypothetical protein